MSTTDLSTFRWQHGEFVLHDYCDPAEIKIEAADSWFVEDGRALAIDLHRERFSRSTEVIGLDQAELQSFWTAVIKAIPSQSQWFPRVELQRHRGGLSLVFRQRAAPSRLNSTTVATHDGEDPRTQPTVKGPDTSALLRVRIQAQQRGADEAIIQSTEGFVIEGTTSAIAWWRGDTLYLPAMELARIDSITVKTVVTLATALGIDVHYEAVRPEELDQLEVWTLSALHGIRIVTKWVGGPQLAEEPRRLAAWRLRLDRLRKPIQFQRSS